jgi:hypothetical protein
LDTWRRSASQQTLQSQNQQTRTKRTRDTGKTNQIKSNAFVQARSTSRRAHRNAGPRISSAMRLTRCVKTLVLIAAGNSTPIALSIAVTTMR